MSIVGSCVEPRKKRDSEKSKMNNVTGEQGLHGSTGVKVGMTEMFS